MSTSVLLRVTYRLRAHHMPEFERIFEDEMMPIFREHELVPAGLWRTAVGEVGEYMELWQLESIADFENRFQKILADPRLQEIFKRTGPMVEDEKITLLDSVVGES